MNLKDVLESLYVTFTPFEAVKEEPVKESKKEQVDSYESLLNRVKSFREESPKIILETPQKEYSKTIFDIQEANPWIIEEPKQVRIKRVTEKNKNNYNKFITQLDKWAIKNNIDDSTKRELEFLAGLESDYNQGIENSQGSTALGYFQFMDSTRHDYNKMSRQQFANDAEAQFNAAVKHIKYLKQRMKPYKDLIKKSGLSDFQILYGYWWNPGDMEAYLKDPSYNRITKYNESIQKTLKKAAR